MFVRKRDRKTIEKGKKREEKPNNKKEEKKSSNLLSFADEEDY